jgi:hypothetical protein
MVQSGSVFVYDEQESGIKRWTDGHSWSPSRILANFLVSLVHPFHYTDNSKGIPRNCQACRQQGQQGRQRHFLHEEGAHIQSPSNA